MTTTLPISDFDTIERGDFVVRKNAKSHSFFKVVDKNHTDTGKVRLVLVNATTIDPKTSTVIPDNQHIEYYRFKEYHQSLLKRRREQQTDGRFNYIGWQYDWSMFDSDSTVIEPTMRSSFNYETRVVHPIRQEIDSLQKDLAMRMENKSGSKLLEIIKSHEYNDTYSRIHVCLYNLMKAEIKLDKLKKLENNT